MPVGTTSAIRLARPRRPRLRFTVSGLLAIPVPLTVYLALIPAIVHRGPSETPAEARFRAVAAGLELLLLAFSGFLVALYRRPCFLGLMVQFTTTPMTILTFVCLASIFHDVQRIYLICVYATVCYAALVHFVSTRRDDATQHRTSTRAIVIVAILAGLANVAMIAIAMMLCPVWMVQARY